MGRSQLSITCISVCVKHTIVGFRLLVNESHPSLLCTRADSLPDQVAQHHLDHSGYARSSKLITNRSPEEDAAELLGPEVRLSSLQTAQRFTKEHFGDSVHRVAIQQPVQTNGVGALQGGIDDIVQSRGTLQNHIRMSLHAARSHGGVEQLSNGSMVDRIAGCEDVSARNALVEAGLEECAALARSGAVDVAKAFDGVGGGLSWGEPNDFSCSRLEAIRVHWPK